MPACLRQKSHRHCHRGSPAFHPARSGWYAAARSALAGRQTHRTHSSQPQIAMCTSVHSARRALPRARPSPSGLPLPPQLAAGLIRHSFFTPRFARSSASGPRPETKTETETETQLGQTQLELAATRASFSCYEDEYPRWHSGASGTTGQPHIIARGLKNVFTFRRAVGR